MPLRLGYRTMRLFFHVWIDGVKNPILGEVAELRGAEETIVLSSNGCGVVRHIILFLDLIIHDVLNNRLGQS